MTEIKFVQVVDGDDDEELDDTEQEETVQQQQGASSVTLSKSWSVSTAHEPTYTGGKLTHCRTTTAENPPFLILPVDGDLALVDANKGTKIRTIRQDTTIMDDDDEGGVDGDGITAHALSWNDEILITCSRNQLIRQYNLKSSSSNEPPKVWGKSGHTLPVTLMEFHSSNIFVATASVDGSVRIWDVRGSYVTHVFRPYQGTDSGGIMRGVSALKWKSNSVTELVIAIGREDGSIAIHNLRDEDHENLIVLSDDHVSAVTCMDWSPDHPDRYFVSSGRDAVLNLWQLVDGQETVEGSKKKKSKKKKTAPAKTMKRIHTKPIYEQVEGMILLKATQSNAVLVATAGSKGNVKLWEYKVDEEDGTRSGFKCVAEQPSSQVFGEAKGGYMDLKFHSHTNQLIVADAEQNLLFLSLSDEQKLSSVRTIVGNNDEILDLKIVPNGHEESTHAVVATNSAQVRVFELGTFSCEILDGHTATVLCVDVSPCGRYIATCGKDRTMRLWRTSSNDCIAVATGHTEAVGATGLSKKTGRYDVAGKAAVNGGGSFAVTASKDRTLKRWNLPGSSVLDGVVTEEPVELKTFCSARAHEKDINIVSVAPNDSLVATGSQDKTVKLWNSNDLTLQATLKGHKRGVWDCQFSPFDRVLASCSGDRTVKLWSLSDYSCVRTFQGHVASALRVRFLSGGLQLVSAGADGLIKLWTIRTNECEATMDGHQDKVWALDLSSDGKQLVSGGADSQIVVWGDTTVEEDDAKRAEDEQNILLEQQLANHLRYKEYEKALDIALDLEKPRQVLKVLSSIVENDVQKGETGLKTLQTHITTWTMEKVTQILKYCRDWNTRARNSHLAMMVVQAVVTTIPAQTLASTNGLAEIFAGITPYAERHFDRLDRLHANAYILDYTLFSMGSLDDDGTAAQEYADWESKSKLLLPPKKIDGRIQVGGSMLVGKVSNSDEDETDDEIMSVGDSDSSDDEA